ncbi:hypothetical protein AB0L82_33390 [Nocardia sp. NPDC052001]
MSTGATADELDPAHAHHPAPPEPTPVHDRTDGIDHAHADDDYYCLAY